MSVLTAYVAAVLQWCGVTESVFQCLNEGRARKGLENAIGYFAAPLYLRVELPEQDRFIDLLSRVTNEYCAALEHFDYSYLESQVPRPEVTCNTCFNWVPQTAEFALPAFDGTDGAGRCEPVAFEHPMLETLRRDNEPVALLYDTPDEIIGNLHFPASRYSLGVMDEFRSFFLTCIDSMLNGAPLPKVSTSRFRRAATWRT